MLPSQPPRTMTRNTAAARPRPMPRTSPRASPRPACLPYTCLPPLAPVSRLPTRIAGPRDNPSLHSRRFQRSSAAGAGTLHRARSERSAQGPRSPARVPTTAPALRRRLHRSTTRVLGRKHMSPSNIPSPTQRPPDLLGQTVVVLGGSAGIGLETARRARAEGREGHPHRPGSRAAAARGHRDGCGEHRRVRRHGHWSPGAVLPRATGAHRSRDRSPRAARRTAASWTWTSRRSAVASTTTSPWRSRSPATPPARCAREAPCSS